MHFELRWYADGASNLLIEVWDSSASESDKAFKNVISAAKRRIEVVDLLFNVLLIVCGNSVFGFVLLCA